MGRSRQRAPLFRQWLEATEQTALPKSPIGQALKYALPVWKGLVGECETGSLSNAKILSEQMVRPVAIGRENYLFLGSDNCGTAAAVPFRFLLEARCQPEAR